MQTQGGCHNLVSVRWRHARFKAWLKKKEETEKTPKTEISTFCSRADQINLQQKEAYKRRESCEIELDALHDPSSRLHPLSTFKDPPDSHIKYWWCWTDCLSQSHEPDVPTNCGNAPGILMCWCESLRPGGIYDVRVGVNTWRLDGDKRAVTASPINPHDGSFRGISPPRVTPEQSSVHSRLRWLRPGELLSQWTTCEGSTGFFAGSLNNIHVAERQSPELFDPEWAHWSEPCLNSRWGALGNSSWVAFPFLELASQSELPWSLSVRLHGA